MSAGEEGNQEDDDDEEREIKEEEELLLLDGRKYDRSFSVSVEEKMNE